MLRKLIIIASLLLVFIVVTGADFDFLREDWYHVEDWEVDVCQKWGGATQAQSHTGGTFSTEFHKMAASVQGNVYALPAGEENIKVYEFSWYFQPLNGSQEYQVIIEGDGFTEEIAKSTAPATTGDSGYHAVNASKKYTHIVLKYGDGRLVAPIVEKGDDVLG